MRGAADRSLRCLVLSPMTIDSLTQGTEGRVFSLEERSSLVAGHGRRAEQHLGWSGARASLSCRARGASRSCSLSAAPTCFAVALPSPEL